MDFNPNNWNWNQAKAAGKNVASYAAGAVSAALVVHLISPTDATNLTDGINAVSNGLLELAKGVGLIAGVLVPIYTAFRAANNASPKVQAASLQQAVPGTVVVTSPEVANAPINKDNPNIVSNTQAKVVSK